jgi:hypothetical protein
MQEVAASNAGMVLQMRREAGERALLGLMAQGVLYKILRSPQVPKCTNPILLTTRQTSSRIGFKPRARADYLSDDPGSSRYPHLDHNQPNEGFYRVGADFHALGYFFAGQALQQELHCFLLSTSETEAFRDFSDHNHLIASSFEHYDQQTIERSGAILTVCRLPSFELDWKRATKVGSLRRTKLADYLGGRLPFHEIDTDLIGEPRVQRANIFWPIWKRENAKSFGIGSDNAQGSVNHDQAGTIRYCTHLKFPPTFGGGAPQLPTASDELAWPV